MAVLKIKDAEGNWQKIPVLGGSDVDVSNLVPKTGDRGQLAGYSIYFSDESEVEVITKDSPDVGVPYDVVVQGGNPDWWGNVDENTDFTTIPIETWTKVRMIGMSNVTLGEGWFWVNNEVPDLSGTGMLVLHWNMYYGVACFIPFDVNAS